MKEFWVLEVFLILVLACGRGGLVGGEEEGAERWVEGLGSAVYAERVRAERALLGAGREAVEALREAVGSADPQVRLSAQRILDHIQSSPENIPVQFRSWVPGEGEELAAAAEKWVRGAVVAAKNVDGEAGTSGNFAQSFVPRCGEIAAVEVCTYPLAGAHGWLRLDLCRDDGGRPSKAVLGRSWVYVPDGHGFPHGGYIVHAFDAVKVDPEELLWMVSVSFGNGGGGETLINYGLSFQRDDYPAGKLWRDAYGEPRGDEDVKFRILEKAGRHPRYRETTDEERKKFPPEEKAHAPWDAVRTVR